MPCGVEGRDGHGVAAVARGGDGHVRKIRVYHRTDRDGLHDLPLEGLAAVRQTLGAHGEGVQAGGVGIGEDPRVGAGRRLRQREGRPIRAGQGVFAQAVPQRDEHPLLQAQRLPVDLRGHRRQVRLANQAQGEEVPQAGQRHVGDDDDVRIADGSASQLLQRELQVYRIAGLEALAVRRLGPRRAGAQGGLGDHGGGVPHGGVAGVVDHHLPQTALLAVGTCDDGRLHCHQLVGGCGDQRDPVAEGGGVRCRDLRRGRPTQRQFQLGGWIVPGEDEGDDDLLVSHGHVQGVGGPRTDLGDGVHDDLGVYRSRHGVDEELVQPGSALRHVEEASRPGVGQGVQQVDVDPGVSGGALGAEAHGEHLDPRIVELLEKGRV